MLQMPHGLACQQDTAYPGCEESCGCDESMMVIIGTLPLRESPTAAVNAICAVWCNPRTRRFTISATVTALAVAGPWATSLMLHDCKRQQQRLGPRIVGLWTVRVVRLFAHRQRLHTAGDVGLHLAAGGDAHVLADRHILYFSVGVSG